MQQSKGSGVMADATKQLGELLWQCLAIIGGGNACGLHGYVCGSSCSMPAQVQAVQCNAWFSPSNPLTPAAPASNA
eukprot:1159861-Pelagomonas_calceolata.AAC.7